MSGVPACGSSRRVVTVRMEEAQRGVRGICACGRSGRAGDLHVREIGACGMRGRSGLRAGARGVGLGGCRARLRLFEASLEVKRRRLDVLPPHPLGHPRRDRGHALVGAHAAQQQQLLQAGEALLPGAR